MNFTVDKEYAVGEVFRHEQTGKMLQVAKYNGCKGCTADQEFCGCTYCCASRRADETDVIYKEVTGPVEGMLYRVEGKLFELRNRSHGGLTCACNSGLMCSQLGIMVFGKMTTINWCWELVEEKKAGAPKPYMRHLALSKAFIDENKATFKIAEQSHRTAAFTPNGNTFTAGNGVKIMSCNSPAIRVPEDGHLFVCGGLWRCDNDELTCSIEFFNKIKEAVKEYNETDGVGYANCTPKKEAPMKKEESIVKRWIKLGPPRYKDAKVYFCIVEQSHVWEEFVPGGQHSYMASNGYILISAAVPNTDGFSGRCYVRGDNKCDDYNVLSMAKDEYDKFVFAVNEYNVTNGCGLQKKVAEVFPKKGEVYHFVTSDGENISTDYRPTALWDRNRKAFGNCFKTEEDASYAADEIASTLKRVHGKLGY